MAKFFALVLFMETISWAVVVKPPFSKKDILVNILSPSNTSTSKVLSTMPIVIDGRYMCPYIGSVYGPMEKDFICADAYVYHLVRVAANTKKSLDCYYDYNLLSGDHTVSVPQQRECPDILVSYAGYKFFAAVYFDEIDDSLESEIRELCLARDPTDGSENDEEVHEEFVEKIVTRGIFKGPGSQAFLNAVASFPTAVAEKMKEFNQWTN